MIRLLILFLSFASLFNAALAQVDMADYAGGWEGTIDPGALTIDINLHPQADDSWEVSMSNSTEFYNKKLSSLSDDRIILNFGKGLELNAAFNSDRTAISGFLKSAQNLRKPNIIFSF